MDSSFGETAKALREQAGLSLTRLSKLARYSRSAIGHAETGVREPTPELAKALDKALGANGLLIVLASLRRSKGRNVDPVKRRDMLWAVTVGSAAFGTSAFIGLSEGIQHFGQSDVEHLLGRTAQLRALDNNLGGADTYRAYLAEVERTKLILEAGLYSEHTGEALHSLLAEQAQLAGWAAFDAGWIAEAEDLFVRSHEAAQIGKDPALRANALALLAYQRAFMGEADTGLAMASLDLLSPRVPSTVQALVFERAAWSFALTGDIAGTERCLERAALLVTRLDGECSPDWAAWVDNKEIQIMSGRCWAALRRPLRAAPMLTNALKGFPDAYARDKALYLLALAEAFVHGSEAELAAATITRAHSLMKGVASTRPKARLDSALALLAPVQSRWAKDFRENLRADQAELLTESRTHLR